MEFYSPSIAASSSYAGRAFEHIITLYRLGVLADNSKVFVNDTMQPTLWSLTDRSALIYVHTANDPGVVRLNNGRLRWGATYDSSQQAPELDLDLTAGPYDAANNTIFVVVHGSADKIVTVVDHSAKQDIRSGIYASQDGVTVIDAAEYEKYADQHTQPEAKYQNPANRAEMSFRPKENWTPYTEYTNISSYDEAHAIVNGVAYATAGKSKKRRLDFRNNLDTYSATLTPEFLRQLADLASQVYIKAAEVVAKEIQRKQNERDDLDPNIDEPDDTTVDGGDK